MRSTILKVAIVLLVIGGIGLNAMAFMHASAMTRFTTTSERTQSPEDLDIAAKIKVLLTGVQIPRPENTKTPTDYSLDFSSYYFPGAKGEAIETWHIANAETDNLVLLFHGYYASKDSLLPVATELHAMGFSTLLIDFFGSGGSEGTDTSIGYFESIDVKKSFEFAQQRWPDSKLILYGQSMGAVAILRAIAAHSIEPDALILESVYDKMISAVKNRFRSMGVPSMPMAELLVFWGGWHSGFNAFKHNPLDYASAVVCPTLVLHGFQDPRATTSQALAVYEQLGGWKNYSSYPNGGHVGTMKSDLLQWQRDIREIVTKLDYR